MRPSVTQRAPGSPAAIPGHASAGSVRSQTVHAAPAWSWLLLAVPLWPSPISREPAVPTHPPTPRRASAPAVAAASVVPTPPVTWTSRRRRPGRRPDALARRSGTGAAAAPPARSTRAEAAHRIGDYDRAAGHAARPRRTARISKSPTTPCSSLPSSRSTPARFKAAADAASELMGRELDAAGAGPGAVRARAGAPRGRGVPGRRRPPSTR